VSYKVKYATELSRRERDVAKLIADDARPAEIAAKLGLSVKTVSTYRARILEKLKSKGVRGNVGIAMHLQKTGVPA
jgi:two-component system, NarL family, invasion response regulator UvrY